MKVNEAIRGEEMRKGNELQLLVFVGSCTTLSRGNYGVMTS